MTVKELKDWLSKVPENARIQSAQHGGTAVEENWGDIRSDRIRAIMFPPVTDNEVESARESIDYIGKC